MRRKIITYKHYLKEYARKLRKNMTLSEVLLWNHLKRRQMCGLQFNRQRPIDNYIVDFYCKDLQLAIEIDGSSHYSEEAQEKDKIRQEKLESLGVRFLRFDNSEINQDMPNVLRAIEGWIVENGKR